MLGMALDPVLRTALAPTAETHNRHPSRVSSVRLVLAQVRFTAGCRADDTPTTVVGHRHSMHAELPAEGWFEDPYRLHQHRWYSMGKPSNLVRDGHSESYDAPPDEALPGPLVPAATEPDSRTGGSDLRRADEAERDDPKKYSDAVWETLSTVFPVNLQSATAAGPPGTLARPRTARGAATRSRSGQPSTPGFSR